MLIFLGHELDKFLEIHFAIPYGKITYQVKKSCKRRKRGIARFPIIHICVFEATSELLTYARGAGQIRLEIKILFLIQEAICLHSLFVHQ